MTDPPDLPSSAGATIETPVPDPVDAHRTKQRRLLFAIELTLFGLVLVVGGSVQAGSVIAVLGLVLALSGL